MKLFVLLSIFYFSLFAVAHSKYVKIGPLIREANGMAKNFDYYDFNGDICQREGYRLPTIKELAMALNPKGVYDKPITGRELQIIKRKDGTVEFYYDYRTYVQAPADHGRYLIRTSSLASADPVARFRFSSEGKIQADILGITIWNATKCAMPSKPSNPILTDLEKNEDGQLVFFRDHLNAEKYCFNNGTRAPTARELAMHAESLGAHGISQTPITGSVLIEAIDPDGKEDRFYYSSKGYIQPGGDYGGVVMWSSSKTKVNAPWSTVWGMHSEDGVLTNTDPLNGAIRCVAK